MSRYPQVPSASATTYMRPTHVPSKVIPKVGPRLGAGLARASIARGVSARYSCEGFTESDLSLEVD